MKEQEILSILQKMGMTYYGAKAYHTLIKTGTSNPTAIAEKSEVPRTKIYEVLNKLEKDNWIIIEKTRPATVKPRYPREVIEEHKSYLNSQLDEISSELTMIYDNILENETPLIRVVHSPDKIIQITEHLIENAKNKIILMGSLYLPYGVNIFKKELSKAKQRGVSVRIIAEHVNTEFVDFLEHLDKYADIKKGHPYYMKNMVVDNKECVFMMAQIEKGVPNVDSTTIIWISSPFLAAYVSSVFEMEWKKLDYYNKDNDYQDNPHYSDDE
ncbi:MULTISPECIES: TrmB family transcriptional regulator [Methanobacterium]|jgi:sugar-specific transcriptional regulator TrmB|uniref:TrmB family transcriptional regulator n=1 Tax=Methanobacterium veterum TaxID=408577 RepID=A0A9E5A1J3_9EURY|nr:MULTISPECIES: helix-turn-helix domain-containing protein [Methanobacterium]MCZ3365200.1 TrmB family transcriptional regulator [Methanobacterium veterum]MCZ3372955.1 TrmB family transcriptional regulator [Methanobacterium veterum]